MAFQHQEPLPHSGFSHSALQQQQVGVRLKPDEKKPAGPLPKRPPSDALSSRRSPPE
jgi:hypothetical protein